MSKAQELVNELRGQGFNDVSIAYALCDGVYLATLTGYTEDDIEEAYSIVRK